LAEDEISNLEKILTEDASLEKSSIEDVILIQGRLSGGCSSAKLKSINSLLSYQPSIFGW
jgi:hypothetical protein